MAVKIIADSSCDLSLEFAAENGIDLVPVHVLFCENGVVKDYTHHKDITTEEFYERLDGAEEQPRTSQPSPYEFLSAYMKNARYDEIICLTVTSHMSGVFNSANLAADLYADEIAKNGGRMPVIRPFDTENCSGGAALLALYASRMAKQGKRASEIIFALSRLRPRVGTFFVLNTLVYARRAGRTGGIRPVLGELLGIKPVLTFKSGVVCDVDIIRSARGVNRWLTDAFSRLASDHTFVVIYHSMAPERAKSLEGELKVLYPGLETLILSVGAVIGVYTGPGCLGISFLMDEKNKP